MRELSILSILQATGVGGVEVAVGLLPRILGMGREIALFLLVVLVVLGGLVLNRNVTTLVLVSLPGSPFFNGF